MERPNIKNFYKTQYSEELTIGIRLKDIVESNNNTLLNLINNTEKYYDNVSVDINTFDFKSIDFDNNTSNSVLVIHDNDNNIIWDYLSIWRKIWK